MKVLHEIISLFFPETCMVCEQPLYNMESVICVSCWHELPLTHFSFNNYNKMAQVFYGRVPIENAIAPLYFSKKNNVQKIIHQLKYKNHQAIGTLLGDWLGKEMMVSTIPELDCVIPVPLHPKKLRKRGYNQVHTFGNSLAVALQIPMEKNILCKRFASDTQTKRLRLERMKNVRELFYLKNHQNLQGKHVLLVDDVITTGATLEACCLELLKVPHIKISIATMAFTA